MAVEERPVCRTLTRGGFLLEIFWAVSSTDVFKTLMLYIRVNNGAVNSTHGCLGIRLESFLSAGCTFSRCLHYQKGKTEELCAIGAAVAESCILLSHSITFNLSKCQS